MICGETPCVCNKPAPKVKRPKAVKTVKPERAPLADRMRAGAAAQEARRGAAHGTPRTPPAPSVSPERVIQSRPVEELITEEAIRALGPILCEADRKKHRMILSSQLTPAEKAAVWKYRRSQ